MIIGLAERFGQSPEAVRKWDVETLRMVRIYDAGRPVEADA